MTIRRRIELGPWRPDMPARRNPGLTRCDNLQLAGTGYRPVPSPVAYSLGLPGPVLGHAAVYRRPSGPAVFAATASGIYWLDGTDWADRSKEGGYAAEGPWEMVPFRGYLVAAAPGVTPQKWVLSADPANESNRFADLGGSPPVGRTLAVIKTFLVLGDITDGPDRHPERFQWSANADADQWAAGVMEAGSSDIPGGGPIQRITGGEFGTIFQRRQISRLTYAGAPFTWQLDVVERDRGAVAAGAVCQHGAISFYLSDDGFFAWNGASSEPLGRGKVDHWFRTEINASWLDRCSAAADAGRKQIVWLYVSRDNPGPDPWPDRALSFDLASGEWTRIDLATGGVSGFRSARRVFGAMNQAMTPDGLGAATADTVVPHPDDPFWEGGLPQLAVFDAASDRLHYLTGPSMAATVETGDTEPVPGRKARIRRVWPHADGAAARVSVAARALQSDGVPPFDAPSGQNSRGFSAHRAVGRFHRLRIGLPSGAPDYTLTAADIDCEEAGRL